MRDQMLAILTVFCLSILRCGDDRQAPIVNAPPADERLALSAPGREFLLGEPVVLDLRFRNRSKDSVKVLEVFAEPGGYEAPIYIAHERDEFMEFRPNFRPVGKRVRRMLELSSEGVLE